MHIFQTNVAHGNEISTMDTIKFQGGFWLVPSWFEYPDKKLMRPERIIRLDKLPHQTLGPNSPLGDFVLTAPIPESVLFGEISPEQARQYEVVFAPDIPVQIGFA